MIESTAVMALIAAGLSAITSALAAGISLWAKRAAPREIEVRFPDGRRHLITSNLSGDALQRELAAVQREISDAVVEQRSASSD